VDRFIYVAMTGAGETLRLQATNSHNLANATTTGFRADLAAFQARQVVGAGHPSRAYATAGGAGSDFSSGAVQSTGRPLDVAIDGSGWIAVQAPDGREAYTRAGDLGVTADGLLTNGAGHPVLGDGGPVLLPPYSSVMIGIDGSVSIVPQGQGPETVAQVGRIRLVDPPVAELVKRDDGLFRLRDGSDAEAASGVRLIQGSLETSNVNVADALVTMIELGRRFELAVKAMRAAEENGAAASQLLRVQS
jgi:flagellar basal-body rod protein FlgF